MIARRSVTLGLLLGAAATCASEKSTVARSGLVALEKSFNRKVETLYDDPFALLGPARGVYLDGYGAVFSAEVNLAPAAISPFRPQMKPEDIAKLRQRKLDRLPLLRQAMRQLLSEAAVSLEGLPREERIAVAVSLFYLPWESQTGLPGQLLMQSRRGQLMEARGKEEALNTAIEEKVF
ncbi:MAG: hypothetical protein FJW40_10370 [Acidobacteria bacterium]|nr:hypothetical protein [Armatimonadota bacterium]MBM3725813.1 hypothetical protein [Acidobacteriota bacterium]